MSWDVCLIKAEGYRSINDLPNGFQPSPLGSIDQVKEKLTKAYPTIVWSEPGSDHGLWGTFEDHSEGYSIEFSLGKKNTVDSLMLHVRGSGSVVSRIAGLCNQNGWKAIDTSAGEFIDLKHPSSRGWKLFQSYRDRVIKP